ncbi:unnamed protein product, partial [Chrysoparadoxa australica]
MHVSPQCSGACSPGFHCPAGSTTATELPCPAGHLCAPPAAPQLIATGLQLLLGDGGEHQLQLCEKGSYCVGGLATPCPEGFFGDAEGLSSPSCSGRCLPGTYCPKGSVLPTTCEPGFTCSTGERAGISKSPCAAGSFCSDAGSSTDGALCPRGSFCPAGSVQPTDCPGGTYGEAEGLDSSACSGPCPEGYFCPRGTDSPISNPCTDARAYCPEASAAPIDVELGHYTLPEVGGPYTSQAPCEPGHYCIDGVRHECAAGLVGSNFGLASIYCSEFCPAGFYCPEGSSSATQKQCWGPTHYCPAGAGAPALVSSGYYSVGEAES